jgi:hypothetical protein
MPLDREYSTREPALDWPNQRQRSAAQFQRMALPRDSSTADVLLGVWLGALLAFRLLQFDSFFATLVVNMAAIVLSCVAYVLFRNLYLFGNSHWWGFFLVFEKILIFFIFSLYAFTPMHAQKAVLGEGAFNLVLILSGMACPWLIILQDQVLKRTRLDSRS